MGCLMKACAAQHLCSSRCMNSHVHVEQEIHALMQFHKDLCRPVTVADRHLHVDIL